MRVVETATEGLGAVSFKGGVNEVSGRGSAEDAAAEGGGVVLEDAALDISD